MKFTTTTAILATAAGLASLASAQVTFNNNGTFSCAIPNGTYCAGANIIIRCTASVGHPGNCDDNLAGEPPLGDSYSPCFDCGANSGRAACSKDGIVYPGSGTGLGSSPFSVNDTSVCSSGSSGSGGAPYPNGTNPGGPVVNATASPTGGYGGPSSSASEVPAAYTGAATGGGGMGAAGAVVGFGAVFVALGML